MASTKKTIASETAQNNNVPTSTASKIIKPKRKQHAATKNSPDSGYPGDGSGLNGELPHNGLDNGFYENLPFHGMKPQQPHKQTLTLATMDPMNVMGLPTTNPPMGPPPPAGGMNHPQTNLTNGGYRCGSNTSS